MSIDKIIVNLISKRDKKINRKEKKDDDFKENTQRRNLNQFNETNYLLDDYTMMIISKAKKIIRDNKNDVRTNIIQKELNDILSILKYLKVVGITSEKNFLEDSITIKLNLLNDLIDDFNNLCFDNEDSLLYTLDSDGEPLILKSIKKLDYSLYEDIYYLLCKVANLKNTSVNQSSNLVIKSASYNSLTIYYTLYGNRKMVIDISLLNEKMTKRNLICVKETINKVRDEQLLVISGIYEKIIASLLEVNSNELSENFSFKKI